jgi:uncharacterized iron-regulated protein
MQGRPYVHGMRALFVLLPCLLAACAVRPPTCQPGAWLAPHTLRPAADPIPQAATRPVILLGEEHDSAADHRWELATIERLYAANPTLALGFEMFPRAAQPALDAWVQGRLTEEAFLRQAHWREFWGFDPGLYLPIFRFARDHAIPMVALNVSRKLVHAVAQHGWDGVPAADREGIGTPAPPSEAYRATLADAMADHGTGHGAPAMTPDRLRHFIEAQTVWDRAMAEAIAAQHARAPLRPVVAIMGAGHLEDREGVPHQLDALGLRGAVVLLPTHGACVTHDQGFADAVYAD